MTINNISSAIYSSMEVMKSARQDKVFFSAKIDVEKVHKVFFKQFSISRTFREEPNLFGTG